jgi:hypothetical protein
MRHTVAFLKSIEHLDKTKCNVCKKENVRLQIDRRIPQIYGGTYHVGNVQYICIDCHQMKSQLECNLRHGTFLDPDDFTEPIWFEFYAFPERTIPLEVKEYQLDLEKRGYKNESHRSPEPAHRTDQCDTSTEDAGIRTELQERPSPSHADPGNDNLY